MTSPFFDYLFGPLDSEYCLYFYILSVLAFISFIVIIIGSVVTMVMQGKFDAKIAVPMLITALVYFVSYFQCRLLYSMCSHKEGVMFVRQQYKKRK